MVAIHTFTASADQTAEALDELRAQVAAAGVPAGFVVVFYGCHHGDDAVRDFLRETFPGVPFLGGTSSSGFMSGTGLQDPQSIGLLVVEDPDGMYGVAASAFGPDPALSAKTALLRALNAAGCPGELPHLVWIYQAPGHEEEVIAGLRSVIGDQCPIIGGSAADDTVSGGWRQLTPQLVMSDGLAIAVLFPSGGTSCAFQSGYEPTGVSGVVTRVGGVEGDNGSRAIVEIDGRSAADVYNEWLGGALRQHVPNGGVILSETTTTPLAIEAGDIEGVPQYLLIHPESMDADGTLRTFVAVAPGTRVHLMRGERRLLIDRAGKVAEEAAARLPGGADSLAGGLMVYCAGCMMAVGEQMPEVAASVAGSFSGSPFLGCFTFGEQGQLVGRNIHGNLMISAVAFGR